MCQLSENSELAILNAVTGPATPVAVAPAPAKRLTAVNKSRCRLWELSATCHCPVIGVCFTQNEVRALAARHLNMRDASDFELHVNVTRACAARNELSRNLQRTLEKRFRLTVARFAGAQDADSVYQMWRTEFASGGVGGALWAALTHRQCDRATESRIYGDIHLIQHQAAAVERARERDLLQQREARFAAEEQLEQQRIRLQRASASHEQQVHDLQAQVAQLLAEKAALNTKNDRLTAQADQPEEEPDFAGERNELHQQLSLIRRENSELDKRAREAELEVAKLSERVERANLVAATTDAQQQEQGAETVAQDLCGKKILCVGGRPGSVSSYRKLVERMGGRFSHHDGGIEHGMSRLDPALASADVIVCQAGCVSHGAYWRVKSFCRRSGKSCVYLEKSGVGSLVRGLTAKIEQQKASEQLADAAID